jgi:hypothetical protein
MQRKDSVTLSTNGDWLALSLTVYCIEGFGYNTVLVLTKDDDILNVLVGR